MHSQFLALVGASLVDPETALRFRRREARRPHIEHMQGPISISVEHGALSFAGFTREVIRGIEKGNGARHRMKTGGHNL